MLLIGNISNDARVAKEMESLKDNGYKISLVQLPSPNQVPPIDYKYGKVKSIALLFRFLPKNYFYWPIKYFELTIRFIWFGIIERPKIIHCHDLLPLLEASY